MKPKVNCIDAKKKNEEEWGKISKRKFKQAGALKLKAT